MQARDDFRKSPMCKIWNDFVDGSVFERAAEVAIMLTTENLTQSSNDMQASAANNLRLQGARLFLETLKKLGRMEQTLQKSDHNLKHG